MTVDVRQLLETMPAASEAAWDTAQLGRYRLLRLIGSGGMGVVVAAHDPDLDREVAIKIIVTGDSDDARAVREAQAMARLSHPNVVQVYEVIRLGARTAIVMELVEGDDLGVWQRTPRSWREVVEAYIQASRGLAAAHRAGIVHRDFKPANALIDRAGVVRVTDFGLARRASPDAASVRDEGSGLAGTPAYMAPEQHRGGTLDARTDQWGLACSLYEALHGRRPFESAETGDLASAVSNGEIDDEPAESPAPRRVRVAIRRALAPDPDERFASVDEFAAALSAVPRHTRYALAAAIAAAAAAVIWVVSTRGAGQEPCTGLDGPMRAVWNDQSHAALRARLLTPGLEVPPAAIDSALTGLDAYAIRWSAARTAACGDTRRGVRSADALDTRMRCLDRRLSGVVGLLEGLAGGDAATLRATSDAVVQLRPIEDCADPKELVARPASAELRGELDAAEHDVARAEALLSLSQFERALVLAEHAIRAGEHAGAPSLTARSLVIRGECEDRLGRGVAAFATYKQAAESAARARDPVVVADALSRSFFIEGDRLGRRADALRSRPYVELAIESAGQPDAVRAEWLHFLAGMLYDDASLVDEALAHERESLAIRRRTLPAAHVYILDSLETLANIEAARKNYGESKRLLEQVLAARTAARGPRDASVSGAFNNLGVVEIRRNDMLAAVEYLQRSVEVADSGGQPNLAAGYNLALTELEIGRWREAAKGFAIDLDRAKGLGGDDSRDTAQAAMFLGVTWIATGDFARGGPMLLRGVDGARRSGSPSLATALAHAARLALHDGDSARARALLDESAKLPTTNAPLRTLVGAEIQRADAGCAVARPALAHALADAVADDQRLVMSLATVELGECEIATGDVPAAQKRLEDELAWLAKAKADDEAIAPVRAALARVRR